MAQRGLRPAVSPAGHVSGEVWGRGGACCVACAECQRGLSAAYLLLYGGFKGVFDDKVLPVSVNAAQELAQHLGRGALGKGGA